MGHSAAVMRTTATIIALCALLATSAISTAPPASANEHAAVDASPQRADVVKSADLSRFQAGNIISDAVFFNSATMSADEIQSFLNSKVGSCQSGYTCLKDYRQATRSIAPSTYCNGYAGDSNESAASIIYKVAASCGINPQVILVTLQKEQGLVTHTWPSDWRYTIAMGQGCPDTAACDTQYYGFQNQVYGAARQFKIYAEGKYFTYYAPGQTWNILYNPNSGCGRGPVYVENKATAGLYYYTPYQPNAAALAAGYGEGDGCSSYGNRNFYQYFTDWFGSTQGPSGEASIAGAYERLGGAGGWLGAVTSGVICGLRDGGCYQDFQNGKIHWSGASGAHATRGGVQASWAAAGWERGALAYPTSEETCGLPNGGCYQDFQSGKIYWSPASGAHAVLPGILSGWSSLGYERGSLGYPVGDEDCASIPGVCQQSFQGGLMAWTPGSGAHPTTTEILAKWNALGGDQGKLGRMVGTAGCWLPNGGCYQDFQNGKIHWSPATGAQATIGGILAAWAGSGYERGSLGYPTSDETCGLRDGGCYQDFQNGKIYWSGASGAHPVRGTILTAYLAADGPMGALGFPVGDPACVTGDSCSQLFQHGRLP